LRPNSGRLSATARTRPSTTGMMSDMITQMTVFVNAVQNTGSCVKIRT
jgi:hypothetical protein